MGLREPDETRSRMWDREGVEMDLVTHDLRKFVWLMLKPNGYVLEQLLSPLVVHTSELHAELVALAPAVVTRNHAHHYRGFAGTQWRLFEKTGELKPLLYTFRALLTGIHLMRSGEVLAHLPTLLGEVAAPAYLPELIEAKAEAEHGGAGAWTARRCPGTSRRCTGCWTRRSRSRGCRMGREGSTGCTSSWCERG